MSWWNCTGLSRSLIRPLLDALELKPPPESRLNHLSQAFDQNNNQKLSSTCRWCSDLCPSLTQNGSNRHRKMQWFSLYWSGLTCSNVLLLYCVYCFGVVCVSQQQSADEMHEKRKEMRCVCAFKEVANKDTNHWKGYIYCFAWRLLYNSIATRSHLAHRINSNFTIFGKENS